MTDLYEAEHRDLQRAFDTEAMAARVRDFVVASGMADEHRAFIESREMFFLSTIDHRGFPTCSYKGGNSGFVTALDAGTLVFPSFDGNGMFLSMGNIAGNSKVGMLFIDFETPHYVRVHGTASVTRDNALTCLFHEAELVVKVAIEEIFVNCPRYIHRHQKLDNSRYLPQPAQSTPPQWKRIDGLQYALPQRDRHVAGALGGTITPEQYGELVRKGQG